MTAQGNLQLGPPVGGLPNHNCDPERQHVRAIDDRGRPCGLWHRRRRATPRAPWQETRGLLCIVWKINKLRIAKPVAAHVSWKAQPTSILEIKYTKDKPVVCAFVHSKATN